MFICVLLFTEKTMNKLQDIFSGDFLSIAEFLESCNLEVKGRKLIHGNNQESFSSVSVYKKVDKRHEIFIIVHQRSGDINLKIQEIKGIDRDMITIIDKELPTNEILDYLKKYINETNLHQ